MPTKQAIHTVNIKSDMPTAQQALMRLDAALSTGRALGAQAVKVIHGYGSTGAGGVIRVQARRRLEDLRRTGRVKAVIPGEQFSVFDEPTRQAFSRCPALRSDSDLDRQNNGVTLVIF